MASCNKLIELNIYDSFRLTTRAFIVAFYHTGWQNLEDEVSNIQYHGNRLFRPHDEVA